MGMHRVDSIDGTRRYISDGRGSDYRVFSRPFRIVWDGWESTTQALQRAGWRFAVERDIQSRQYRIALQHRALQLTGMTAYEVIEDWQATDPSYPMDALPLFHVSGMGREVFEMTMMQPNFYAVDMEPQYTMQRVPIHELGVFNRANEVQAAEEVLVEQADMDVVDHLDAIKKLQSGKQKELREKARRISTVMEQQDQPERNVIIQLVNYRG